MNRIAVWRRVAAYLVVALFALLTCGAIALLPKAGAAAAGPGDWPQWQGSAQHQGINTATTIASPLATRWMTDLGSYVIGQVVANGVVYVTTQDVKVRAIDAATGTILWTYQADGPGLYPPIYDSGTVFVLNAGGPSGTLQHVVALDGKTGALKWVQYLTTAHGTDGAVPAVGNGVVYVAGGDWKVHAFDEQTGAVLWRTSVDDGAVSSPAIGGSFVYANTFNQATLYAFDPLTGAVHWSETADGNWYENNPIVDGNRVYTGGTGNRVHAVDAITGSFIWTTGVPTPISCTPALGNGMLYKSYFGYGTASVYSFDAVTGARGWTYQLPTASGCPAVTLGNGVAYIRAYNGALISLDAATGGQISAFQPAGSGFVSSPAIGPNAIYVGSADGKLYALTSAASVGGIAELPDITTSPQQAVDTSGLNTGVLAGTIAGAVAAGILVLSGLTWYARRHWLR